MTAFKFRGKNRCGRYVYGTVSPDGKAIILDNGNSVAVTDVALMVGFDKNGKEVYSDDVLISATGSIMEIAESFPVKWKSYELHSAFYNKNGKLLDVGDIVTYNVQDETETLQSLRPPMEYLKHSRLMICKHDDNFELRWYFGKDLQRVNKINLDSATAKALITIGHIYGKVFES